VLLAQHGLRGHAVDNSPVMLDHARGAAAAAGVSLECTCADIRTGPAVRLSGGSNSFRPSQAAAGGDQRRIFHDTSDGLAMRWPFVQPALPVAFESPVLLSACDLQLCSISRFR